MYNITTTAIARSFYGVALMVWGVQQVVYGKMIAGRPMEWPVAWQGEWTVAALTGALFVVIGAMIVAQKKFTPGLIVLGVLMLGWAAITNAISVVAHLDYGFRLTNLGKSVVVGLGAFLVLQSFDDDGFPRDHWIAYRMARACRYGMGFFLLASGIQHFLFVDFVKQLIPAWLPGEVFWVYLAGVALIFTGLCLLTGLQTARAAAAGSGMILSWVFIVHLPRAFSDLANQNEMTALFEALSFSGLLFLIFKSH